MALRSPSCRVLAWLLIILITAGCSSWQPTSLSPNPTNAAALQPEPVKLRLTDNRTVTLHNWTLESDTLRGSREAWVQGARVMQPEAIALSNIARREGRKEGEVLPEYLAARQAELAAARELAAAPPPPKEFPGVVRFRLVDGSTIELENAAADGDSLRGRVPVSTSDPSHRLVILARKDILLAETNQADTGKTVGLAAGIVVVVLGALFVWALTTIEDW